MKKLIFILFSALPALSCFAQVAITNDAAFTTPQSMLHIYRNANGSLLQLSNNTTTNALNRGLYFTATGNDFSLINNEAGFLRFHTSNTERMRISATGNVGIGNTNPIYRLDVYGISGASPARFASPDGYVLVGPANTGWSHFMTDRPRFYFNTGGTFDSGNIGSYDENLSLQTSGITRITVLNSNGNTGIGTTTPAYRLDLANGTFGFGSSNQRTETRDNAGLQGNAGAQSGFFETASPTNYPSGASSWWHLIDCRHSNTTNNYALQIAGSFFDQKLYFRKTNNSATTGWRSILSTDNDGTAGQILVSQGAGTNPVWQNPTTVAMYGNNATSVSLSSLVTNITTTGWSDIAGMSITFTPVHNYIYIFSSLTARLADNTGMAQFGQAIVAARILVGGVQAANAATVITDFDEDSWGGTYIVTSGTISFSGVRVAVTPGTPIQIKLQWKPTVSWANSPWRIEINPGVANDHCTLTIFD